MKKLSLLVLAPLFAIPATASAGTLYFVSRSSTGQTLEQIDYASVGNIYVPGGPTASGVVSSGAEYSSLTVGDINGDGYPDINGMIQGAINGTETPTDILVEDLDGKGKVIWSVEMGHAMVYQVSIAVKKQGSPTGSARPSITFVDHAPTITTNAMVQERRHRDHPNISEIALSAPGVQDPQGVTGLGDVNLTFPPSPAAPGMIGALGTYDPITITTPAAIDDGYAEWFNSVVTNGADVRPVTITYSFTDGSAITIGLNMQLNRLEYSTTAKKKGTASDGGGTPAILSYEGR